MDNDGQKFTHTFRILRSTMANERLGPLILLSLNKDISLDVEEIVDDFAKANNRRLELH